MTKVQIYKEGNVTVFFDTLPVDMIIENKFNPNVMDEFTEVQLEKSMEAYGYIDPILVAPWFEDGEQKYMILDGHHRLKILKKRGMKEIPCIVVEGLSEVAIKSGAYTFNVVRGRIDMDKVKNLVKSFLSEYGENVKDDISKFMLMSRSAIETLVRQEEQKIQHAMQNINSAPTVPQTAFQRPQQSEGQSAQPAEQSLQSPQQASDPLSVAPEQTEARVTTEPMYEEFMVVLPPEKYRMVVDVLRKIDSNLGEALVKVIEMVKDRV